MHFISRNLKSRPGVQLRDIPPEQAPNPPDPELPPDALVAEFVGTPRVGYAPLTVTYTDLSEGGPDVWAWNLGEGLPSVSVLQNPVYTYTEPGLYDASLTVTRTLDGATDNETKLLYIEVLAAACINQVWKAFEGEVQLEVWRDPNDFSSIVNRTERDDFLQKVQMWGINTFEPDEQDTNGTLVGSKDFTYTVAGQTGVATFATGVPVASWEELHFPRVNSGNVDRGSGRFNLTFGLPSLGNGDPDWGCWLETAKGFTYTFSIPINSFGFYVTDVGDFGGTISVEVYRQGNLIHNEPLDWPNGIDPGDEYSPFHGSLTFFGIQRIQAFDEVRIVIVQTGVDWESGMGVDYFGFDQIMVGGCAGVAPFYCYNDIWFGGQGAKSDFESPTPPTLAADVLAEQTAFNENFAQWGYNSFEPAAQNSTGGLYGSSTFTYSNGFLTGTASVVDMTVFNGSLYLQQASNPSAMFLVNANDSSDRTLGRYNMTPGLPMLLNGRADFGSYLESWRTFSYGFTVPIHSFSCFITDTGDFSATLAIELYLGGTLVHAEPVLPRLQGSAPLGNGTLAFFGIQRVQPFNKVRFIITQDPASQVDVLGFDEIRVGGCAGVDPVPMLVLTGPTGTPVAGSASAGGVISNISSGSVSFTLSANNGAAVSPASGTLAAGQAQQYTFTPVATGPHVITLANGAGLPVLGSPLHQDVEGPYNWAQNVLMHLAMDGADGSPSFTDSSSYARTVTVSGGAQITTAQSQYGGASALFAGNGYLSIPAADDLNTIHPFASSEFYFGAWVRLTSNSADVVIATKSAGVNTPIWQLRLQVFSPVAGRRLGFLVSSAGGTTSSVTAGTVATPLNVWNHIALVKRGLVFTAYLNGQPGTAVTMSTVRTNTDPIIIGGRSDNSMLASCQVDDVVMLNRAPYQAAFTPSGPGITGLPSNSWAMVNMTPPYPPTGQVSVAAGGGTITNSGSFPVGYTLTATNGATMTPSSGILPPRTSIAYTITPVSAGAHTITLALLDGSSASGSPITFTATAP